LKEAKTNSPAGKRAGVGWAMGGVAGRSTVRVGMAVGGSAVGALVWVGTAVGGGEVGDWVVTTAGVSVGRGDPQPSSSSETIITVITRTLMRLLFSFIGFYLPEQL
jgi:hypothetical protein